MEEPSLCAEKFQYDSFIAPHFFIRKSCMVLQHFSDNDTLSSNIYDILNETYSGKIVPVEDEKTNKCYSFPARSQSADHAMNFIIDVYVVSAIWVLGFIGNCLSMVVMHRLANRVVGVLFTSLAIADNVLLLSCFFLYPVKAVLVIPGWRQSVLGYYYPYVVQAMWPLASTAQMWGILIVVLITVDRYLALRRPLSGCRLGTRRQAVCAVLALVLGACVFNVPRCFEYVVRTQFLCHMNATLPTFLASDLLARNRAYFVVYNIVL